MSHRPNIIFIMADDMGYGDFGRFSEGRCRTPNLDRLVDEGLCLTQHYSAAPVCTPARAGLLTGRYPIRTGGIDMRESRGLDRIATRERTIGDHFRRAGYATGLIGKWHNGAVGQAFHPNARGFDEFFGFRHGQMSYFDWRVERNGSPITCDGCYLTDVLTEEAVDFVGRHARENFFLALTYNAPHTPLEVPDEDLAPYRNCGRYNDQVARVYAMVSRMDKGIGRLLEALAKNGLANNTLVCFTSDNGPAMYGGMDRFNCNYRGGKAHVYEGGIRVPMVLRYPGQLPAGERFDHLAHFCDWLPTLLAAAGGTTANSDGPPIDGNSLWPALRGDTGQISQKRFWQWSRYLPTFASNVAMRDGNWKLVRPILDEANWTSPEEMAIDRELTRNPASFDPRWLGAAMPPRTLPPAAPWELYDLAADPAEQHNLAAAHPDTAHRMARELETWFESVEHDRLSIADRPE